MTHEEILAVVEEELGSRSEAELACADAIHTVISRYFKLDDDAYAEYYDACWDHIDVAINTFFQTRLLEVKVNAQDNLSRTQEYFISAAQVVYEMAQLAFEKVDQMEYEDSRDVVTAVITQAMEFEELHKNTNWDSEDFLFAVEASFDENILKRWAKKEQ